MHYLAWLVLSSIFVAIGEYYSKQYAYNPSWRYIALCLLVYNLGTFSWFPAIRQRNQLTIVGPIWSVLSLVVTLLIGILVFDEKVDTMGKIGIALSFLSILFLSLAS